MGSFATDQSVGEQDLQLLQAAVQGDGQALIDICTRYTIPVLAVALRSTEDLERAHQCVEQVLSSLCRQLLAARFPPDQWASQLIRSVAESCRMDGEATEDADLPNESSLSGMDAIPRIARRRAVNAALPKLPLPELTAVLLTYADRRAPRTMVGLVADSEAEVCQRLASAHELLLEAVRTHPPPA